MTSNRVNRALFISKVMESAQQYESAPAHHQLSNRDVSQHSGPGGPSGYNTLQGKSDTMQQGSEEAEGHNGGQQQLKQEDDALTNSTQKGEPGNGHAVGSRDHMEADAE